MGERINNFEKINMRENNFFFKKRYIELIEKER